MSIQAFIINENTHDYVPISERESDKPFTATIKQLKPQELAALEDDMAKINNDQSLTIQTGRFNYSVLRAGLVGWFNFKNGDKDVKPKKTAIGVIDEESLNMLPPILVAELSEVILNISRFPTSIDVYLGKEIEDETK